MSQLSTDDRPSKRLRTASAAPQRIIDWTEEKEDALLRFIKGFKLCTLCITKTKNNILYFCSSSAGDGKHQSSQ